MKTEPNTSAFPITTLIDGNWTKDHPQDKSGLTKREYFAAKAMQGMISNFKEVDPQEALEAPKNIAEWSVLFADRLIEQLNKEI